MVTLDAFRPDIIIPLLLFLISIIIILWSFNISRLDSASFKVFIVKCKMSNA